MSFASLLTDEADVLRATTSTNEFGQQIRDWDNPTVVATIACSIQPQSSNEITEDRQTVSTEWLLYSEDEDAFLILATDRVRWNGSTFDVDVASAAMAWRAGFGAPAGDHHVELRLSLTRG